MSARYEVRMITGKGEKVLAYVHDLDTAFTDCLTRWASRKPGQPVFAVRDAQTEQRWSYSDIQELRSLPSQGEQHG